MFYLYAILLASPLEKLDQKKVAQGNFSLLGPSVNLEPC